MPCTTDEAVAILNRLIAVSYDAQDGYRLAAEGAHEPGLRALFRDFAEQRACFAEELQADVRRMGGEPATAGSVAGAIRRGWLDVKLSIVGGDDVTIIRECERGDQAIVGEYHEAEQVEFPAKVMQTIYRQAESLEVARDRMHLLWQSDMAPHARRNPVAIQRSHVRRRRTGSTD